MDAASVFKKLRFDPAIKSLIINAPSEYEEILKGITYNKDYDRADKNTYDFIQVFAISRTELEQILNRIDTAGKYDCLFWICYPKGGGKNSDLKRDDLWKSFSLVNLRPVTQISLDDNWTAMRGRPEDAVGK